jgi:2-iminoacetate synthase
MTMFQETYNRERYLELHPAGPKRDFAYRLDAPERAALGGMRGINLGALLGLDDWRRDIFLTALHAEFLLTRYPHLEVSISVPRMRPLGSNVEACHSAGAADQAQAAVFQPQIVDDRSFVQALTAVRCFLPQAGITLSTREPAWLRDKLLPLGVTRVSAGVCTAVGGHTQEATTSDNSEPQFEISDPRSVDEMVVALKKAGFQPVFTDWLLPGEGTEPLTAGVEAALGNATARCLHESAQL